MNENIKHHFLFVINPCSGEGCTNWKEQILTYLAPFQHQLSFFNIDKDTKQKHLEDEISKLQPSIVIAVGGDGTIRFVAKCLIKKNILLGIIPAGSANGLALELGLIKNLAHSLNTILTGLIKTIHVIELNDQLCVHLSDVGLNANAMRIFDLQKERGFWGYFRALLKVIWKSPKIRAELAFNDQIINVNAELIVIANSTTYGTGAVINPIGVLNDTKFEIIVVKIISIFEIFKMVFSYAKFDPNKIAVYQTSQLLLKTKKNVHFQIDGEYLGKVNEIKVNIIPNALSIIVPSE